MTTKLSCVVPCRNEEANIGACLLSILELADEIVIADSGSSDSTMDIAAAVCGSRGRIIEREYRWSGDFKNWAIEHATHEWVLIVDADERITPELASEIRAVLDAPDSRDGYWIYRRNHFLGRELRFCGMQNDCCLRLFRRSVAQYVGLTDHAEVEVRTGRVGSLRSRMPHFTAWKWDDYLRKLERYSTWQAKVWHDQGRRAGFWNMVLRAPLRFFRDYLLQLGFLDGKLGFQYCMLQAWYAFMKQARLWEHHHALPQPEGLKESISSVSRGDCSSESIVPFRGNSADPRQTSAIDDTLPATKGLHKPPQESASPAELSPAELSRPDAIPA